MQIASEQEAIRRAQAGDRDGISHLYEKYHLSIYRYLYYRVGDAAAAEDLCSDTFLRMLRSLPQYRPDSVSFQAWLFQIARNLSIDHYRKSAFRDHSPIEDAVSSPEEPVDTTVQRTLDQEHLRKALTQLPDDQRDVLILRFVSGMPVQQAAQTLHKSEDAIKGLQRRALIALRQILSEWEVNYVEAG